MDLEMEGYYQVTKKCSKCGTEVELTSTPFFKWEDVSNFLCEKCEREKKLPIIEKMREVLKQRGHEGIEVKYPKEEENCFFFKYRYKGKNYIIFLEK